MFINLSNEEYAALSALARDRGELTAQTATNIIREGLKDRLEA